MIRLISISSVGSNLPPLYTSDSSKAQGSRRRWDYPSASRGELETNWTGVAFELLEFLASLSRRCKGRIGVRPGIERRPQVIERLVTIAAIAGQHCELVVDPRIGRSYSQSLREMGRGTVHSTQVAFALSHVQMGFRSRGLGLEHASEAL